MGDTGRRSSSRYQEFRILLNSIQLTQSINQPPLTGTFYMPSSAKVPQERHSCSIGIWNLNQFMAPLPLKTGDRSYYKAINKRRQDSTWKWGSRPHKSRLEGQSLAQAVSGQDYHMRLSTGAWGLCYLMRYYQCDSLSPSCCVTTLLVLSVPVTTGEGDSECSLSLPRPYPFMVQSTRTLQFTWHGVLLFKEKSRSATPTRMVDEFGLLQKRLPAWQIT